MLSRWDGSALDLSARDSAAWERAEDDIEAHRCGELIVRVVDQFGQPLERVPVLYEQVRHAFRFGVQYPYDPHVYDLLQAAGTFIANNIYGSTSYLNALDLRLGVVAVVIIAADHRAAHALMDVVRETWTGNMVLTRVASGNAIPPGHPAHGKTAIAGAATAYVCREGSCSLPASEPGELRRLLSD